MGVLSLRETQELFASGLGGDQTDVSKLVKLVDASYGAPATARTQIYCDAYFLRLNEVLRLDFPRSRNLLGATRFSIIARDYIRAHPSHLPSITWFGREFAGFLAKTNCETPWLGDLAHLEWSIVEAAYAPSSPAIAMADLAAIEPGHWGELTLSAVASLRCLKAYWPIDDLWNGAKLLSPKPQRTMVRVWRKPDDTVAYAVMKEREEAALSRMLQGKPFGQIVEVFAHEPDAPSQAAALLGLWLADGLLSSVRR